MSDPVNSYPCHFWFFFVAVPVIPSPIIFFSAKSYVHGILPKLKFGFHFWIRWTSFSLLLPTFFRFCCSQITFFCEITHATVPKLGIHFWIRWTSAKSYMEHFIFDTSKYKIQNSLSDPVNDVSDYFCCFSDIL